MIDEHKKIGLHLLMTITPPAAAPKIEHMLRHAGFAIQYGFRGEGTASSETRDMLGVVDHDRALTLSILPSLVTRRALSALSDELDLHKAGHGIAFTVPISGISRFIRHDLAPHVADAIQKHIENEVNHMVESSEYSLIIVAVNQGYDEEVMDTVKELGVIGGTVIHARRLGLKEKMKFWGISVQSEKELIAIIAEKGKRLELMHLIGEKYGLHSKAMGLIFSLPVDGIAGLGPTSVL